MSEAGAIGLGSIVVAADRLFDAIAPDVWLAVALVLALQRLSARLGLWPFALFALPGTLAHELAHWLVAKVLFAQPTPPRLWPERSDTGWRLGSVRFVPRWWRTAPIALAPLALLPLALWWMAEPATHARGAMLAVHAWIAGTLVNGALPSRADLRLAAPALLLLSAVAFAVAAAVVWR